MWKRTKVLALLISITATITANEITFKELAKLASKDLKANIYVDKDIANYMVDINVADHQYEGEMASFFTTVLINNGMQLKYNSDLKYFTIVDIDGKKEERQILPASPLPNEVDKQHYYTYKIKNITNQDVIKTMSIFNKAKYVYLAQSDIISYSCTKEEHIQIQRMLKKADNKTKEALIKITLFTTNKNNLITYGSSIRQLSLDLDANFNSVFDNLLNKQSPSQVSFKKQANFGFTFHALKGQDVVEILQEPTIRVTNGEKATVRSGLNVAYKESTVSVRENQQTTTDNIKYRDVGIKIDILPKIKDNWVHLKLNLVSEELLSLQDNIPLTQKITYQSSVTAKRGEPVLLTGIKRTSMKIEKNGVPLLSDIPLIGELFKDRTRGNEEQNINILIEVL